MYDTTGNESCPKPIISVVMVRTVVMPRDTRAGAEFLSTKNESHETKTTNIAGM